MKPGAVVRQRLVVREPDTLVWGAARRLQFKCRCGAHHVVDLERIRPVFEGKVSAGLVRSNGWVDVHTGEF
jgi:hypothetical protein